MGYNPRARAETANAQGGSSTSNFGRRGTVAGRIVGALHGAVAKLSA
jgi:hypothetical protein